MTPAIDSIHERILQSVRAEIDGLGLTGINAVYAKAMPEETGQQYPCFLVTLEDGTEEEGESTFCDDDVIYPVNVYIADTTPGNLETARQVHLGWRSALMRHFRGMTTLPNVPESYDVKVKGNAVWDSRSPQFCFVINGFVVRVYTREPRKVLQA